MNNKSDQFVRYILGQQRSNRVSAMTKVSQSILESVKELSDVNIELLIEKDLIHQLAQEILLNQKSTLRFFKSYEPNVFTTVVQAQATTYAFSPEALKKLIEDVFEMGRMSQDTDCPINITIEDFIKENMK